MSISMADSLVIRARIYGGSVGCAEVTLLAGTSIPSAGTYSVHVRGDSNMLELCRCKEKPDRSIKKTLV